MKTRCIAIVIGLLLIASTAFAISPDSGVILDKSNGSVKSTEPCDNFSSSILPRDFDYGKGYGIEKIGENRYVAYISMPMDSADAGDKAEGATVVARALAEGWSWWDFPGFEGSCLCVPASTIHGNSPEMRTNHTGRIDQRIFLRYRVPAAAAGITVLNATLNMYCCESAVELPLVVECWDAILLNIPGLGTNYVTCCGGAAPYCDPTGNQVNYNLLALESKTTVSACQTWYSWDVTSSVQRWADNAPGNGDLMLYGVEGGGAYKRFSTSCNYPHPNIRPVLKMLFTR